MKLKRRFLKRLSFMLAAALSVLLLQTLPAYAQSGGVKYQGIDVSKYDGQIDWNRVKNSGVQFAMIRTGYGGDIGYWDVQTDPYFASNYQNAVSAGVKVGVYHYSYATNVSMAEEEADFCLHILNGRRLDYPVAYDIEDPSQAGLSGSAMSQIVRTFCEKIQQAGYRPIVYSYVNFYNARLTSPLVSVYDTWIADYIQDSAPHFNHGFTMWQYSSGGSVPGVGGRCDMDYSYVDYSGGGASSASSGQSPSVTADMDPMTFLSDTSSYTFGGNRTYVYKITTPDTYPPSAVSSNLSAVIVSSARPTADGFLFTLTNVGPGLATITTKAGDGRSVSFVAAGNTAA